MVKVQPGQCPSSAPAPPQGAPGGSGQLGTPSARPNHWAPRHSLGRSSQPPRKAAHFPVFGHAGKEKGSIFDALEDLDYQACLDKCVAISKA